MKTRFHVACKTVSQSESINLNSPVLTKAFQIWESRASNKAPLGHQLRLIIINLHFIPTVFKFSYWSLQDIYEFVTVFSERIWTSVELKIQIRRCDITSFRSNWWKWLAVEFLTIMLTEALQTFRSFCLRMACTFPFISLFHMFMP